MRQRLASQGGPRCRLRLITHKSVNHLGLGTIDVAIRFDRLALEGVCAADRSFQSAPRGNQKMSAPSDDTVNDTGAATQTDVVCVLQPLDEILQLSSS